MGVWILIGGGVIPVMTVEDGGFVVIIMIWAVPVAAAGTSTEDTMAAIVAHATVVNVNMEEEAAMDLVPLSRIVARVTKLAARGGQAMMLPPVVVTVTLIVLIGMLLILVGTLLVLVGTLAVRLLVLVETLTSAPGTIVMDILHLMRPITRTTPKIMIGRIQSNSFVSALLGIRQVVGGKGVAARRLYLLYHKISLTIR